MWNLLLWYYCVIVRPAQYLCKKEELFCCCNLSISSVLASSKFETFRIKLPKYIKEFRSRSVIFTSRFMVITRSFPININFIWLFYTGSHQTFATRNACCNMQEDRPTASANGCNTSQKAVPTVAIRYYNFSTIEDAAFLGSHSAYS